MTFFSDLITEILSIEAVDLRHIMHIGSGSLDIATKLLTSKRILSYCAIDPLMSDYKNKYNYEAHRVCGWSLVVGSVNSSSFFINKTNHLLSCRKITEHQPNWSDWQEVDKTPITLDALMTENSFKTSVLIITTQGSEVDVILSGINYIFQNRPIIVFTNNLLKTRDFYNIDPFYFLQTLESIGYRLYDNTGRVIATNPLSFSQSWMFIAIPRFSPVNFFLPKRFQTSNPCYQG